jgi:peptidoglycan/xylan/chitin deacetylase (PgdA/CDA1 family)
VALAVLAVATGWWRLAVPPDQARISRASTATPSPSFPAPSFPAPSFPVPSVPAPSPLSGGVASLEVERIPYRTEADVTAAVQRFLATGEPIRCGGGTHPVVALTFEDGPGPNTVRTVRLLRRHGADATFFLNGIALDAFSSAVPAALRVGEIGNHGWSHQGLVGADPDLLTAEVDVLQARLAELAGTPPRLFRPPHEALNEAVLDRARSLGILTVLSTVDVGDDEGTGEAAVWSAMQRGARPGSILTLRENQEVTRSLLPDLLALLEQRGLQAVTVPELLAIDPPTPEQLRDGTCPVGG